MTTPDTCSPLGRWERLPGDAAVAQLLTFCASRAWAVTLISNWTYSGEENFLREAEAVWFSLSESDWLEAFAAHPRIGEKKLVAEEGETQERAPFMAQSHRDMSEFLAASAAEQSTTQQTLDQEIAEALIAGNHTYEQRFGFRYIVFASGRTAPELLAVLNQRLTHTREEELQVAAREQHRITTLRMAKWLEGLNT